MVTYKVNNKRAEAPTCWEETKTGQYEDLYRAQVKDNEDELKAFCIITGLEAQAIASSRQEDLNAALYQATAFIWNQGQDFFRTAPMPDTITLGDKAYPVPRRQDRLSITQNLMMRRAIKDPKNPNLECLISRAISITMQPIVDGTGDFDQARADILQWAVRQRPIAETFAFGFFLLTRAANFGSDMNGFSFQRIRSRALSAWRSLTQLTSRSSSRSRTQYSWTNSHSATPWIPGRRNVWPSRILCPGWSSPRCGPSTEIDIRKLLSA